MKSTSRIVLYFLFILLFTSFESKKEWTPLLDKKLSQWDTYLSFPHKVGYKGEAPMNEKGKPLKPIGYNKNVNNVFSIIEEEGQPVLKITGEIYGCIFTKQDFENYHLKLQVKWGEKKWDPRKDELMDSGILYHSQGKSGVDYWRSWMLSQEFQIIEKGMGDYWPIANSQIDIKVSDPLRDTLQYDAHGTKLSFGRGTGRSYCQVSNNAEKPKGEWNTLELICYGDKSVYIVNGEVVMTLSNSRYQDGETSKPLTKGKIQLQSEAAEVFFKDVMIKDIDKLEDKYASYFQND